MAIGVICALNLTSIINGLEYLIGHKFLSGDIYFIDFLPSELHWLDVILCAGDGTLLLRFAGQLVSRPPRQPHRPGEGAEWPVIPVDCGMNS